MPFDLECEDDCTRCSGEYCETHITDPCDCDCEERHRDPASRGASVTPRTEPRCIADKNCPMTAGYYIGGGQYICWLHAMTVPGCLEAVSDQQMCALKGDKP